MRAYQTIQVTNTYHTISATSDLGIHITIKQNNVAILDEDIVGDFVHTFLPAAGTVDLSLSPDANKNTDIKSLQLEPLAYSTSYIKTGESVKSRGAGVLTVPVKITDALAYAGTLFFWFNPQSSITTDDRVLVEFGGIRVTYNNSAIEVEKHGTESPIGSLSIGVESNKWYPVLLSWSDANGFLRVSNGQPIFIQDFSIDKTKEYAAVGFSDLSPAMHRANALIDDMYIVEHYRQSHTEFVNKTIEKPYVYISFDGNVSKFDNSLIELEILNPHKAPVVIEKADGTPLRRMTFMDPDTGEYIPYGIQRVKVVTSNVFELPFDDIDNEVHKPVARSVNGDLLTVLDVSNNKITLDIDPRQYYGQTITIIFYPKNCYTVDYKDNGLCRIMLGKHDGQAIKVTYERDGMTTKKLLTNIDLNAMNNPNHDGFIYLTRDIFEVENINYTIYPRELRGDGHSTATIVVETRDRYGNIVTDVDIEVVPNYGSISIPPQGYVMEVPLQQQAGRVIFTYNAPIIDASIDGYVFDDIVIKAKKNEVLQMSVKTSIRLLSV
jgi:hypothetical protein